MRRRGMLSLFEETGGAQAAASGAPVKLVADAQCRVCELEAENAWLRLLVGELLVANQRLRESVTIKFP